MDEVDIQLSLRHYNSNFVTYELSSGFYTIKDFAEGVYNKGDHAGTLPIDYYDITMKTKLNFIQFSSHFGTSGFDEKSFLDTSLGFRPFWAYKHTIAIHADSPGVYTSDKILHLSTIDKIHLKCDVIDGSVVSGIQEARLTSFVLDKPPGYKVFCEPETIHYRRINKNVLNTITFYLEMTTMKK